MRYHERRCFDGELMPGIGHTLSAQASTLPNTIYEKTLMKAIPGI